MSALSEENPFNRARRLMDEAGSIPDYGEQPSPEPQRELTSVKSRPEPIPIGEHGIEISNTDQATRFASVIYKSKLLPNSFRIPEQVVIAILRAIELKLPILQALEGMSVVNGKVGVMGDLALAICISSGLLEDWSDSLEGEGDERKCTFTVKRKDKPTPLSRSFSIGDAKRAKLLGSSAWQGYTDRMLYYRALGFALRDCFPDILKGIKTTEELRDYPTNE